MDRLSKEQWVDHGLATLAQKGFTALKADKLAKSLGVSRGSFYWHFKNLAEYHSAVLHRWQELNVTATVNLLEGQGISAETKLRQLLTIASSGDNALAIAMRAWGFDNANVQASVNSIDEVALGYVRQCLLELGVSEATASLRAYAIFSMYIGQVVLAPELMQQDKNALIDELMTFATAT